MDFELQNMMDWFEDNKEWLILPAIITGVLLIIGFVLMLITSKDVNLILKFLFILLFFASPILGYFIGPYIDPYLAPVFSKISNK